MSPTDPSLSPRPEQPRIENVCRFDDLKIPLGSATDLERGLLSELGDAAARLGFRAERSVRDDIGMGEDRWAEFFVAWTRPSEQLTAIYTGAVTHLLSGTFREQFGVDSNAFGEHILDFSFHLRKAVEDPESDYRYAAAYHLEVSHGTVTGSSCSIGFQREKYTFDFLNMSAALSSGRSGGSNINLADEQLSGHPSGSGFGVLRAFPDKRDVAIVKAVMTDLIMYLSAYLGPES